jgi:hypothetical protein
MVFHGRLSTEEQQRRLKMQNETIKEKESKIYYVWQVLLVSHHWFARNNNAF